MRFYVPQYYYVDDKRKHIFNNDTIDRREDCKYFRIDDITSVNGDARIALSAFDIGPAYHYTQGRAIPHFL